MQYVIYCLDRPGTSDLRNGSLPAHRDYVDKRAGSILMSGPLLADDGVKRMGQLYVIEAPDAPTARQFIDNDPFTIAGLFESLAVHRFTAKFLKGQRELN